LKKAKINIAKTIEIIKIIIRRKFSIRTYYNKWMHHINQLFSAIEINNLIKRLSFNLWKYLFSSNIIIWAYSINYYSFPFFTFLGSFISHPSTASYLALASIYHISYLLNESYLLFNYSFVFLLFFSFSFYFCILICTFIFISIFIFKFAFIFKLTWQIWNKWH
jgi:hypothetical protein